MASLGRHGPARHGIEDRRGVGGWHRHGHREDAVSGGFSGDRHAHSEFIRRVSFASRSEWFGGADWRAWGWHAGPWPWAAWAWPSLAIGVSFGLVAAPPVIVAPPPFYAAPPPIIAALPAIAPPPLALPPNAARSLAPASAAAPPPRTPLPPPAAAAVLGAAMPPPIVVLPPPLVVAAAGPPPLIVAPPQLALVITPPVLAFFRIEPAFGWHGSIAGLRETSLASFGRHRAGFDEVPARFRDGHRRGYGAWEGLRHRAWARAGLDARHPSSHGRDPVGWREARGSAGPGRRH